jgi:hypothetical protein
MENPSPFSLKQSLSEWRHDISNNPAMSESSLDELESHLQDSIETLEKAGLSEQEAFIIATRRLGPTDILQAEYAKENQATLWRHNMTWLLFGWISLLFIRYVARAAMAVGFLGLNFGFSAKTTGLLTSGIICLIWITGFVFLFRFTQTLSSQAGRMSSNAKMVSKWSFPTMGTFVFAAVFISPFIIQQILFKVHSSVVLGRVYQAGVGIVEIGGPVFIMLACLIVLKFLAPKNEKTPAT